ncbi:MAG: hypothetical protein LQ350_007703 [Teloschistes chrysophthalmus]|nr:MAG: hypothetical protein LQ350_007703 [Niorma chrysophthalma]
MALKLRPSTILPFLHPRPLPKPPLLLPSLPHLLLLQARHASHAEQSRANGPRQGPGKRLGAKKSSQQYVVPGNIIFRQRGTHWFPGENCGMGRDHTIFAKERGYVVFYRDPQHLSLGVGGAGYGATPEEQSTDAATTDQIPTNTPAGADDAPTPRSSTKESRQQIPAARARGIRPGYMFREANWQIGRVENEEMKGVRKFVKGDRFLAWRKKNRRLKVAAEKRTLRGQGKKKTGGR